MKSRAKNETPEPRMTEPSILDTQMLDPRLLSSLECPLSPVQSQTLGDPFPQTFFCCPPPASSLSVVWGAFSSVTLSLPVLSYSQMWYPLLPHPFPAVGLILLIAQSRHSRNESLNHQSREDAQKESTFAYSVSLGNSRQDLTSYTKPTAPPYLHRIRLPLRTRVLTWNTTTSYCFIMSPLLSVSSLKDANFGRSRNCFT